MLSRRPRPSAAARTAIGAPNDNQRPPPAPFIGIERGPSRPNGPHPSFQPQGRSASVDSGLVTAGADRVLTLTLHAPQVHGFFSVPVDHLNALDILAGHFRDRDLSNTVVVSPDFGRAKDAAYFGRLLGIPVAAGNKQRISDTEVIIDTIVGDVDGKKAIVLDEEIATGGSILTVLDRLSERGVEWKSVVCTHGLFTSSAPERFRARRDVIEYVTTDTVSDYRGSDIPNLHVLSVAPLLGEAMRRIHVGESVSSLFGSTEWTTTATPQQASL